ncbi:MAG: hypothetical protein ACE5I1_22440 [bacterium]
MTWNEIRTHYPHRWLLVEALEAHSDRGKRILDKLAVVDTFADSREAMKKYAFFHRRAANREFYVLHTDRDSLEITERQWLGIRGVQ